eukprot:CAMPEP_0114529706 /NCGR_PEP_ID=MMETSP0109-20121206/25007_1 /TAXON_ID=29199 /ORGANISM="Chlorarachnion reptans, Strain CCCM449" /LENGTH=468 /DNA_ID=CAMNT_0001712185 /DNA_START=1 /DNA_END=1407 /DNA_ORIENTATION=+
MAARSGRTTLVPPLLLLLATSLQLLAPAAAELIYDTLDRQIDLRGQAERVRVTAVVRNDGTAVEDTLTLAIPADRTHNVSYVKVTVSKRKLVVEPLKSLGPRGEFFFRVKLLDPIRSGQTQKIVVQMGFVGVLIPHPAVANHNDPHLVKYTTNLYETTPYSVKTQTTVVKFSTSNIISSTKAKPYSSQGDKITYGPYTDLKPFEHKDLNFHFETKAQFSTVTALEREIKICHWGGAVFSETYDLRNSGANLKDAFHRIDYERMQRGYSFEDLSAKLPKNSYGIDFRDDIGNISTSHVRETSKHVLFQMRPRFPLFGGWHSIFKLFYTVPIEQLVSSVAGTSSYVLNTTFSTPFDGLVIEDHTVKVVLPEGSSNIKWVTPFPIESVDKEILKTYLDLTGRPVLVLKAKNLMRFHNQYFQVMYSYPNVMIHRGPLFVMIGFMVFFGSIIMFSRMDLSIGRNEDETKPKVE